MAGLFVCATKCITFVANAGNGAGTTLTNTNTMLNPRTLRIGQRVWWAYKHDDHPQCEVVITALPVINQPSAFVGVQPDGENEQLATLDEIELLAL